ncbi:hypothetical protein BJ322DRAFT_1104202 [Thelephora terrestris]|uniref:DUF6535 domain-containing protein n=1 Tax=Thelephora terrestris TaxID=56493 RepID=A0A9P6HNS2_9AGAM|nr:hypothetical protein BJ322DRAFT_1104202 [Thelephora terrestris]
MASRSHRQNENKETAEYDRDFLEKYHDNLNTASISAGLFSAATATFIVGIQPQLSPDYRQNEFHGPHNGSQRHLEGPHQ